MEMILYNENLNELFFIKSEGNFLYYVDTGQNQGYVNYKGITSILDNQSIIILEEIN